MIDEWLYTLNCQLISYINLVTNKLTCLCMYFVPVPPGFTNKAG